MDILVITFAAMVANAVGIISGFGTGTIMTPTLLLFLPFGKALFLSAIIVCFHNVWKALFFRAGINWNLVKIFGIPGLITSVIGAMLIGTLVQSSWAILLPKLLGVFLVVYAVFLWIFPDFKLDHTKMMLSLGGSLQGFFAGLFGVKGPIRTAFLIAYDLPKAEYLGTVGAISLILDGARLGTYWMSGMRLNAALISGLWVIVPASYVAAKVAQNIVGYIPQEKFRHVVLLFLCVIGVRLMVVSYV